MLVLHGPVFFSSHSTPKSLFNLIMLNSTSLPNLQHLILYNLIIY